MFCFLDWLAFAGHPPEFEELPVKELAKLFKHFYAEVRTKDGSSYSRSSLLSIRRSLHRYLTSPPYRRKLNIMSGEFQGANAVISGMIKTRQEGSEDKKHQPITEADIKKMYSSRVLSNDNPTSLQYKVFFEICLHFGKIGRDGLHDLKRENVVFTLDTNGKEYVTVKYDLPVKNQCSRPSHDHKLYATNREDCPLKSLKKYISKLNPENSSFFQKPKVRNYIASRVWYKKPLGINAIGRMMSTISEEAKLSIRYTNHCIRVTTVATLSHVAVSPLVIASISDNRSAASIESNSTESDVLELP